MTTIPLEQPIQKDIYSYDYSKSLYKIEDQTSSITQSTPTVYDVLDTAIDTGQVVPTGNLTLKSLVVVDQTIVSLFPILATPTTTLATKSIGTNTTLNTAAYIIPQRIVVKKIMFSMNTLVTAGKFRITIYSENGRTKLVDVLSPQVTGNGNISTILASDVSLSPGIYYIGIIPSGTASGSIDIWAASAVVNTMNNLSGEPKLNGNLTVEASTAPITIDPTALTAGTDGGMIWRLDN